MRWIGREVKRFISEAHIHIPFLLRLANAPPEVSGVYQEVELDGALLPLPLPSPLSPPPSLYLCVPAEDGAYQAHEDDELFLTPEELEAEAQEEPQMMAHAAMWDRYLAYVAKTQEEWAAAPADTDEYRKGRAVEYFNLGTRSYLCTLLLLYSLHPLYFLLLILYQPHSYTGAATVRDLYALNPALAGWVPHVLVFIVPRQIVPLGDPSKRSCDACESLGAKIKKIIRNNTCRRRPTGTTKHAHRSADGKRLWLSTFTRGY